VRGVEVEPRLLYTVEFIAANYLDPSGRFEVPQRALQGLGAELHLGRRVHFALEVRNLLDVRTGTVVVPLAQPTPIVVPISDFLGYPLPGRSLFALLRVDTSLPRRPRRRA
jgi:iron complex outermembrane receptor protein